MRATCNECKHRIKMASGKGYAMYCDLHYCNRTRTRHLRVKCNQPACDMFSPGFHEEEVAKNQLSLFD